MKKFYCFGKKDFCDDINECMSCEYADDSGGEEREVDAPDAPDMVEVVRCDKCEYLEVINNTEIYAKCKKTDYEFKPFDTDTRKHYCSFGKRKES